MIKAHIWLAFFCSALLLQGCSGKPEEEVVSEKSRGNPKINFLAEKHDFGKISRQERVTYTYRFINEGDGNLLLTNVVASCGCTVPRYTQSPVSPGDTGRVRVIFDPSHFVGNQFKSVKVYTNASGGSHKLEFSAYVKPPQIQEK